MIWNAKNYNSLIFMQADIYSIRRILYTLRYLKIIRLRHIILRMYDFRRILGKNIRRISKKKGLSQLQLSSKANVSVAFINSIENAQKWASATTLEKICDALEIKPYELFLTEDIEAEELQMIANDHEKMITDIKDIIRKYSKD